MLLKASFAYFVYNFSMGIISALFPPAVTAFLEGSMPVKGTISSVATFVLFYSIDACFLHYYMNLVNWMAPIFVVFEACQITNFTCKASRILKNRIDFDKGLFQLPAITILIVSMLSLGGIIKFTYLILTDDVDFQGRAVSDLLPWLRLTISLLTLAAVICVVAFTYISDTHDAILSNGMIIGFYMALLTYINLMQLSVVIYHEAVAKKAAEITVEESSSLFGTNLGALLTVKDIFLEYQHVASKAISEYLFKTNQPEQQCEEEDQGPDWNLFWQYMGAAVKIISAFVINKLCSNEWPWAPVAVDGKPAQNSVSLNYFKNALYICGVTHLIYYLPSYTVFQPSISANYDFPSLLPKGMIVTSILARLIFGSIYFCEKVSFNNQ